MSSGTDVGSGLTEMEIHGEREGLRRRWLAERSPSLLDDDEDPSEVPGLREVKELLARDDETSVLEEEEGCPLPSTPVDPELLDCEVSICHKFIIVLCSH